MAQNNVSPQLKAGGNILPHTFVKPSATADNTGLQCGANEQMLGISQEGLRDAPGLTGASSYAAIDGDTVKIYGLGDICLLKAGSGGYTRGDRLKSDATGGGVPIAGTGANQNVGAIALESAAAGELGRVQIILLSIEPDSEAVTYFADDQPLQFGTGQDTSLEWSTNDASDHSLVLGLGDTSQMLHITDLAAKDSDWAVTSPTHPTVYIHSNTTPITDYLAIGAHDGTTASMDVVGGTTLALKIAGTAAATLTATALTLTDAVNIVVDSTTGTKIGTATTQKLGFFNATPVVQRSAYTQTYSTADKTHASLTCAALTDNTAGTANTTLQALSDGTTWANDVAAARNNFADLAASNNAIIVDLTDLKQLVNSIIDDLQALGLVA